MVLQYKNCTHAICNEHQTYISLAQKIIYIIEINVHWLQSQHVPITTLLYDVDYTLAMKYMCENT